MQSALTIDALRHGETTQGRCFLGRTDAQLTELGWAQMEQALQNIVPSDYDLIISSPLLRCQLFARHWLKANNSDPSVLLLEPAIQEYDFGDWDGLTAAQVMQKWPVELGDFWRDPENYPPANAESLSDFFQRLQCFVSAQQGATDKKILLMTHGGVIKALTCLQQNRPASEMAGISAQHGELHRFVWGRV